MKHRLFFFGALVLVAALACYAYRNVLPRPFAADDYEWLLNTRGRSFGGVLGTAFDATAQTHFYRPLVWLLFWAQTHTVGLQPAPYHVVNLVLHLLNAALLGVLAWRLGASGPLAIVVVALVALHPAPFEAVVWASAQSELLAALLLLLMLHAWRANNDSPRQNGMLRAVFAPRVLVATLLFGLALLAKESAVIGLPLLLLLGWPAAGARRSFRWLAPYALPLLLTLAYVVLQINVEQRNYLLKAGSYGVGPQLWQNPLRILALVVAPLSGTEHANAAWLLPVGAVVALVLAVLAAFGGWNARRLVAALALTLLPTAPFVSPPDSRYLYLPVLAAALLLALVVQRGLAMIGTRPVAAAAPWALTVCALALLWPAMGEVAAREARFAAASGPGGSLWHVVAQECASERPKRVLVVEPPLAAPHALAIVRLACGKSVSPLVVTAAQIAEETKGNTLVVTFPNGSAAAERRS